MSTIDDVERIVEFKLRLARVAEDYLLHELRRAARAQKRRLPAQTQALLRTGALAAVARLGAEELSGFAASPSWTESVAKAVQSGAWSRLLERAVHHAFGAGPA